MRSILTRLVALLSLFPLLSLPAQTDQPVLVGKRVRITMPDTIGGVGLAAGGRSLVVIGQLVAISDSTISLRHDANSGDVTVSRSRVQRLEVSHGSNRSKHAVVGGLIGLGIGGVGGYWSGDDCPNGSWLCFSREDTAVIGGIVGAAVGSLIGLLANPGERWREASVPRVSVVPTGAGSILLTSTLRF